MSGLRKMWRQLIALSMGLSSVTPAVAAASPSGEWAREDGSVRARIARCGLNLCATTIWAKDPNSIEKTGDRIILLVKANEPGHWTGSAIDPRRSLNFSVDLRVSGERLTTRGCLSGSATCMIEDWVRVGK